MLLPFLFFIMIATWAFPQSAVLFRSFWTIFRTVGGYYAGQAWKTALWMSVVYFATIITIAVAAVICMVTRQNVGFAIVCFTLAVLVAPLNGLARSVANAANLVLPTNARINQPRVMVVLILIVLNAAITALFFSSAFYSWYGVGLLALLIFGEGWIIAFPSDKFYSRYVLAGLTAATFIFGVLCRVPFTAVYVDKAKTAMNLQSGEDGRDNIIARLKERPVQVISSDKGADVWEVELDQTGAPVLNPDGLAKIRPFKLRESFPQWHLNHGDQFKTLDITAPTVDAGELLVKIYLPQNGKWIKTEDSPNIWVAISDTDLMTKKPNQFGAPPSTAGVPELPVDSGSGSGGIEGKSKVVRVNAINQKNDTGIDLGGHKRVKIEYVSGSWSNTNGNGNIRTDGNGSGCWDGLVLPCSTSSFRSLIGYSETGAFAVGDRFDGKPGSGRLYLGMNDIPGKYSDNWGDIMVKVTVID